MAAIFSRKLWCKVHIFWALRFCRRSSCHLPCKFFFFDVGGAFLVFLVGISMVINVKVVETFVKRVFPAQASARMCGTRKLTVFFLAVWRSSTVLREKKKAAQNCIFRMCSFYAAVCATSSNIAEHEPASRVRLVLLIGSCFCCCSVSME